MFHFQTPSLRKFQSAQVSPQGSVLGPRLFILYINDVVENIQVKIRLYTDDCILYNDISTLNDQLLLN